MPETDTVPINKMPSGRGISVILCTWNRSSLLRSTLYSLNDQSGCGAMDVEVIVVDNNSTDDTRAVVEDIGRTWKLGELRYSFEGRQGKQFALNHGIRLCRKDVLAFSDDDVLFPKDWISNISRAFEDERLDLAGGKTVPVWPDSGKPRWFGPGMSAVVGAVDLGERRLCPPPEGYAPAGANLVARRALFERVGLFSETHFRHMDYEFGLRCARAKATISYEPSLVVYAPVATACLSKRYFRRWSFKAGIADDGQQESASPTFLLVPRWIYRRLVEDCVFVFVKSFSSDPATIFSRELRIWRDLGTIAGRWHAKWRPRHHSEWVQRFSQKKKDLY